MKRTLFCTLIIILTVLLVVPPIPTAQIQAAEVETAANIPLDFHTLAGKYGEQIPVVAKFTDALTSFDADLLKSFGVSFSLGSAKDSYLAGYYLLRGSAESLELLKASGLVKSLNLQTTTDHLVPARDLSIPEINADQVWNALDGIGRNITGEGILIADLDTGVDWQHPDLWFADGAQFDWLDENSNNIPDNGTDGVDLDSSGSLESYEVLRYIVSNKMESFKEVSLSLLLMMQTQMIPLIQVRNLSNWTLQRLSTLLRRMVSTNQWFGKEV
ncbi:MAG: hypothetical protein ACXADL_13840 [Candidatus Thorarchaeota archaeon]|jgi:hypothetical protein